MFYTTVLPYNDLSCCLKKLFISIHAGDASIYCAMESISEINQAVSFDLEALKGWLEGDQLSYQNIWDDVDLLAPLPACMRSMWILSGIWFECELPMIWGIARRHFVIWYLMDLGLKLASAEFTWWRKLMPNKDRSFFDWNFQRNSSTGLENTMLGSPNLLYSTTTHFQRSW